MKCLITGCYLIDEAYPRFLPACDLYEEGDCFIILANKIEPEWHYSGFPHDDARQVIMVDGADPFIRRGIIAVRIGRVQLNDAAAKYIRGEK